MVQQMMGSSYYTNSADYYVSTGPLTTTCTDSVEMTPPQRSSVCKMTMLKKVKTNKYKFFVLHKATSGNGVAKLEYYDTESHFNKGKKPKRSIILSECFSITSFSDSKVKYGVTLFNERDSFHVGFEAEQMRDMWLADMRLLRQKSSDKSHSAAEHTWSVRVQTRSMKCPFVGCFKLCLNDQQASLTSRKDPDQVLVLPVGVMTHCTHNNKYFALEVNHNAQTGPGEIWMELEDSLIAQHVHRAFSQILSAASPGEDSFRPVSRSLSFKDKKSIRSARLRSGSDARARSRMGQSLSKLGHYNNPLLLPASSLDGLRRERSDSVDSHSTCASLSTDESECCQNWQNSSRSTTPDMRNESQQLYLSMNLSKRPEEGCKCLSSTSSLSSDVALADDGSYADMSCGTKSQDKNSNFVYVDMSGCHTRPDTTDSTHGYLDMTAGSQSSAEPKGYKLKPETVKCYLAREECSNTDPKLTSPPNVRHQANHTQTSDYVDMYRRRMLTGKDKSSSAPHLMLPVSHLQHHHSGSDPEVFMNMEFDNRNRAASLSCAHRPRGSSWSQFLRPRSSTTEQKRRSRRACNNNIAERLDATDYIDMTRGPSTNSYVEMSLDKNSKHRLAAVVGQGGVEREDKENHLPPAPSHSPNSRVPAVAHPFPELLSASSDDDVSVHSMDGSVSFHSLTSSADSMSTSSHSSHHSTAFTSSLDMEPYVAVHTPATTPSYIRANNHRLLQKPVRVPCYIVDDTDEQPKASSSSRSADYMEMSPSSSNKNTKQ